MNTVLDIAAQHRVATTVVVGAVLSWVVGGLWRESHRSLRSHATPVIGLIVALGGITWLWKNRRDMGRAVAALVIGATVAGWALAAWLVDGVARTMLITGGIVGGVWAFAPGGKLDQLTGGRTVGVWWDERLARLCVQHAVSTAMPGATAHNVRVDGEQVSATVVAPTSIDPNRGGDVGARLNQRGVLASHHAVLTPTVDGAARLVVHTAPEPSPWDQLEQINNTWTGPHSARTEAPVAIGVRPDGTPLLLPLPGVDGGHWIAAGQSGGGKSQALSVLKAEVAGRPHLALIDLDPHGAEALSWRDRATLSCRRPAECEAGLAVVERVLDSRLDRTKDELDDLPVGADWPFVLIIIEEFSALEGVGQRVVQRVAAEARKVSMGLVLSTQRPSVKVVPGDARHNFSVGVAFGWSDSYTASMVFGENAPSPPPVTWPGAMVARHGRDQTGRSRLLVPKHSGHGAKRPYRFAAQEIAQATSHLRVEKERIG